MLQKIKLNQTAKYEQAIAGYYLSEMVVAFTQGRIHTLDIGAEQGDIKTWDDLVLRQQQNHYHHLQIKSQFTNFPEESCIRDNYKQGDRKGTPRDRTTFDITLENLAKWSEKIDPSDISPSHSFTFCIPSITLIIKEKLTVKNLSDLISLCIKPQIAVADLVAQQAADSNIQNCFNYLTTWCAFTDWDHILKTFRCLKFRQWSAESEINAQTDTLLANTFSIPSEARKKIIQYLLDNTTFSGAISPRALLFLLKDNFLPSVQLWTQVEKIGSTWEISGIQDLKELKEIERPEVIVPALWENDRQRSLKIILPVNESCTLLNNVIHLALHLTNQVSAHTENKELWQNAISNRVGGTLGISNNDCDNLSLITNTEKYLSSNSKPLTSLSERDTYAESIHNEIIKNTWGLAVTRLEKIFVESAATELRDAAFSRWKEWRKTLDLDSKQQHLLLKNLVHPQAEGADIDGDMRIGPKTVGIIADGIHLLLIVSVALSDDVNSWALLTPELTTKLIGIEFWSGAGGQKRKAKPLDNDGDILELIGKEPTKILILSGVKSTPTDIYAFSLAEGKEKQNDLAQPHRPKLLLTYNTKIKMLINEGKIAPFRIHLEEIITTNTNTKNKSIYTVQNEI